MEVLPGLASLVPYSSLGTAQTAQQPSGCLNALTSFEDSSTKLLARIIWQLVNDGHASTLYRALGILLPDYCDIAGNTNVKKHIVEFQCSVELWGFFYLPGHPDGCRLVSWQLVSMLYRALEVFLLAKAEPGDIG